MPESSWTAPLAIAFLFLLALGLFWVFIHRRKPHE
jgi:hypothetical protein